MKLNGSEIVIECLKEQGVDTVFGYPGGTILNVYDALYKHGSEINHILTSHEQGAAHAADGYARATGKSRRMYGNFRSRSHESGNRYCNRIYGFNPNGCHHSERSRSAALEETVSRRSILQVLQCQSPSITIL